MTKLKLWFFRRFLDASLPVFPIEILPEDKMNLGLLHEDDMYRSLNKLMKNYEFIIRSRSMNVPDEERQHYRGQLFCLLQLQTNIKKFHTDLKRRKMKG